MSMIMPSYTITREQILWLSKELSGEFGIDAAEVYDFAVNWFADYATYSDTIE